MAREHPRTVLRSPAVKIAAIYALFGVIWILASDTILAWLVRDVNLLTSIQMYKGWFYVLVTAALVLQLVRRQLARLEEARAALTESEARLHQSQKMEAVGRLAGGVAHDFNNILTAILGNVEIALLQTTPPRPGDESLREILHDIRQGAQRAGSLTRQLLIFSRKEIAKPVVLDLRSLIREMEKMLRRLIGEDIELGVSLAEDLSPIRADVSQIEQVVMNLAVNARDAMADGGELRLSATNANIDEALLAQHPQGRPGRHVQLTVSDTGCGMDPGSLQHIFEPFFTTKDITQGTGLGLSTVYGIVQNAGGFIEVESEPERGTTFKVFLPAVDEAPASVADSEVDESTLRGSETILVCEDDRAVRELTVQILSSAGYSVLAADRGEEALRRVEAHDGPLDLLVTDVIMPDMNGKTLADRVTALVPGISVLFVSGYTTDIIAHHGVLEEGVEFLEKPFNRVHLLRHVRGILGGGRD